MPYHEKLDLGWETGKLEKEKEELKKKVQQM
jgi:hypothetical protein